MAVLFETNNAQAHLDSLQVTNANAALYVTSDTNQIKGFLGGVSPMLTVWRRLHLEVDSMEAVTNSGSEANFESGIVRSYLNNAPVSGQSVLGLSLDLRGSDNAYENGRIEITNVGTFNVVRNIDRWFAGDDAILSATPGTNVIAKGFRIYDDDDRFLSTIGLASALPKDNESPNIVQSIRPVFFLAYIDVTNANAMNLNPRKRISFKRNVALNKFDIYGDVFADGKDVSDSTGFWAHTLVFGYQPSSTKDLDPNNEHPDFGISPEPTLAYQAGISVVFIEIIRDTAIDQLVANQNLPQFYLNYRTEYTNWISGIAAHEIGHSPGRQGPDDDHNEDGLMNAAGQAITSFSAKTVRRFRTVSSWTN